MGLILPMGKSHHLVQPTIICKTTVGVAGEYISDEDPRFNVEHFDADILKKAKLLMRRGPPICKTLPETQRTQGIESLA